MSRATTNIYPQMERRPKTKRPLLTRRRNLKWPTTTHPPLKHNVYRIQSPTRLQPTYLLRVFSQQALK